MTENVLGKEDIGRAVGIPWFAQIGGRGLAQPVRTNTDAGFLRYPFHVYRGRWAVYGKPGHYTQVNKRRIEETDRSAARDWYAY